MICHSEGGAFFCDDRRIHNHRIGRDAIDNGQAFRMTLDVKNKFDIFFQLQIAKVAELVDALDSKSSPA